jgi:hypothetical protein
MHFLVIDHRYGTPIHVFLELDPREHDDFPELVVRRVDLDSPVPVGEEVPWRAGLGVSPMGAVGQSPWRADRFQEFGSDRAVAAAGYVLIEPRYVGETWSGYLSAFRPEGGKPVKRPRLPAPAPVPRAGSA